MKILPVASTVLATLLLGACSDNTSEQIAGPDGNVDAQARLKTFDNSEAFYSALRDALIHQSDPYNGAPGVAFPETDADFSAAPSNEQSAPDDLSDSATGSGNDVTSTNVQELGVDEQDRVKLNADGTRLFVLNTDYVFYGFPEIVVDTDVAEPMVDPAVTMPADLPFVSPEAPRTTLRILALDAETPDATSIKDLDIDLSGSNADGFYLFEDDEQSSAIITASGGGYWGYWDTSIAFSGLRSIIAKVDVTDPATAALSDTFTIDGQIISSRRIGDSLFFASRYYPSVPGPRPWEVSSEQWQNTVASADLAELMPRFSRNDSDESTSLVNPAECFVAPGSDDQPYYTPDIITLGVIDLKSMQLQDSECFLGATETLYASTEAVYLATTKYDYSQGPITTTGLPVDVEVDILPQDIFWFDPRTSTDIHKFDIDGSQLNYEGSGSVRGHLGWNDLQKPFRMSDRGGVLRVATMNDRQGPDHSPILLNALQSDGQGNLRTIGSLPNDDKPAHIGKPGERLYASRFLGDRAYLVTFRQTDPLYIVDLSDPTSLEVLGELEIDGYSDYLHPIGENHLLGIGKDAVPASDGRGDERGAWVQGIKLSLFDVSDAANPTEVDSVLVGERGTDSVALRNHRAITIQAANDSHPTRVSFGIDVYGDAQPTGSPSPDQAWRYAPWNYTGLHGFDITAGANASISSRGAMIIDRATGANGYYGNYGDDRSVMVRDAVFYIHGTKVFAALWDNLAGEPQPR